MTYYYRIGDVIPYVYIVQGYAYQPNVSITLMHMIMTGKFSRGFVIEVNKNTYLYKCISTTYVDT